MTFGESLSSGQFIGAVHRLSAGLQSVYGLTKGKFVGLVLPNCAELVVSALAVMRCGGVVSPMNPTFTIGIIKTI